MALSRFGGSEPPPEKNALVWLVALAAVLAGTPCLAQSTGVTPVAPDSTRATDSAGTGRAGADSAGADSAGADSAGADSAVGAPGDTLTRPGQDSAAPSARPSPPPAPTDSSLGAACEETAGGPPDLLLVTFRPGTTVSERAAVAREVGGTLLGKSEYAAPGSWYLRVPDAGDRSVADRLILLSPILEVGTTRCPA